MISEQMAEQLNNQMNIEFFASYKYLAMSAYCQSISLNGFGNWFSQQSQEESSHAMKIYAYLLDQDSQPHLLPIPEPQNTFSSIVEVFEKALESERHVTSCINELAALSMKLSDHATHIFLHWFVTEQVEEESTVRMILDQVRMVAKSGEGLLLLDRELGQRKADSAEKD